jgi:4-amino-4-deoxy-L-arabinose transferase-like glycosyltransferase
LPDSVGRVAVRAASRAKGQVRRDLRADPYLACVLVLAAVLSGFWLWHTLPNFATRDERWRLVDSIEAIGFVVEDPSLASLRDGVTHWRSYGAAFYLFGIAVAPVVLAVFVTGNAGVLTDIAVHDPWGYWDYWNRVPANVWTAIGLLGRVLNVALAVGCVYVLYRIGTVVRDRGTGRLAALLLTLTWGFLVLAHEAGEDVPALFFFLLAMYLLLRYVETGTTMGFYAASVAGGVAMALKLTTGVIVVLVAAAYVLRARRTGTPVREAVGRDRGRTLRIGAALGIVTIVLGYPVNLVGAPHEFLARVGYGVVSKAEPHYSVVAPSWWWILRGYLNGFGLPLFLGVIGGALAAISSLRDRSAANAGVLLSLTGIGTYLAVFGLWAYVRTHHLLPTFPLLLLVLAVGVSRLSDRAPTVARLVVVVLVVSGGLYAGTGDLGYASQPRDQARAWLSTHAPGNATIETYINDPQDAAVPHGMDVSHVADRRMTVDGETRRPGVGRWILAMPERCPAYVQLTYHGGVKYLAPANYSTDTRFILPDKSPLRAYVRDLLAEDTYPYAVVGEFGPRPRFVGSKGPRSMAAELLHVGVTPRSVQYGDPQDFGVAQYTVILERTGECNPDETSPLGSD